MKLERDALLESIRKLNKEKPLKEDVEKDLGNTKVEITATLDPADAARMKEHEEAIEAHDKRIEDAYRTPEVKELLEETASEESRYAHFDVVDRKELAKRINEAKEKGCEFKISRSTKDGFRYDFKVLKEEFVKRDAGDPEINKDAFNKATDVGSECSLGEDIEGDKSYVILHTSRDAYGPEECFNHTFTVNELIDFLSNEFDGDLPIVLSFDRGYTYGCVTGGSFGLVESEEEPLEEEVEEPVKEELKVYTSTLAGFEPSAASKELWDEIKDANKVEDLEYQLEVLYPEGISDIALDDLLKNEGDWVRDLVGLGEKEEGEEPIDEFEDEDIEPVESEEPEDEDIEPLDYEAGEEIEESVGDGIKEAEEEIDDSIDISPKKELTEEVEETEPKEEELSKLAEGFVNTQFKPNEITEGCETAEPAVNEAVKEASKEDEVVAVDDSLVEDMMGLPKTDK